MKTFIQYLTEAKDRFINKNRNLSKEQKKELIDFFKTNRQAESDIDWNKSHKYSYDQFFDIMAKYRSGRRKVKKFKCQDKLKGLTKDQDYVHVRMKTKEYCAYIPLSHDTAQKFNTDRVIGTCQGSWCVGHSSTKDYWTQYVLRDHQVPIYIVDQSNKWIVMIDGDNRSYDVWDLNNDTPNAKIPDFDVKKELLSSKQQKLYDEIRNDIFAHDDDGMEHVDKEKKQLFKDIKDNAETVFQNYKDFKEEWDTYIKDLLEFWLAKKEDYTTTIQSLNARIQRVTAAIEKTSNDFDTAKVEGQLYTRVELRIFKDRLESGWEEVEENWEDDMFEGAMETLEEVQNASCPLDEDEYENIMDDVEDYDLSEFGLRDPDWDDVYDESYHKIDIDDYPEYMNYCHGNHYMSSIGEFQDETNQFIKEAHIDPKSGTYRMRTKPIDNEEIYEIFESNDMY